MPKISILVKVSKNFDFGQILTKISIFGKKISKIATNFDFGQIFRKISILVKFSKNYVFGQIFETKFDFD